MKSLLSSVSDDRSIMAVVRRTFVNGNHGDVHPLVLDFARNVSRIGKFRLDPVNLGRPSALPDPSLEDRDDLSGPRVMYRGDGLATVLYSLNEKESPILEEIKQRVAAVVDGFEDFEFNVTETDKVGFSVKFDDSRGSVFAANLSDGTLSIIGFLTLLLTPARPAILCVEEPENGLTPKATSALYETFKQISAPSADHPSQVLVSSHSPFVICEAWNGVDRDFLYQVEPKDGSARIRKVASILEEEGIQLRKKDGTRNELGLRQADLLMGGFYS
jgi:hypothetical protein